jgi:hypothetical protein
MAASQLPDTERERRAERSVEPSTLRLLREFTSRGIVVVGRLQQSYGVAGTLSTIMCDARLAWRHIRETRTVSEWEYRKVDLNQHRPQGDELDLLNAAGAEGWELVGITSNNFAYLKREVVEIAAAVHAGGPNGYDAEDGRAEVKVKYRDPVTNETWSGRGRMANWLKRKQEAGEDIEEYLV